MNVSLASAARRSRTQGRGDGTSSESERKSKSKRGEKAVLGTTSITGQSGGAQQRRERQRRETQRRERQRRESESAAHVGQRVLGTPRSLALYAWCALYVVNACGRAQVPVVKEVIVEKEREVIVEKVVTKHVQVETVVRP